jgi:aryl-alcohol dehydrogenase-like predicted oxidoreductase
MNDRILGKTDFQISEIGYGAWGINPKPKTKDKPQSQRIFEALESGHFCVERGAGAGVSRRDD